jgi:hypothetical protein
MLRFEAEDAATLFAAEMGMHIVDGMSMLAVAELILQRPATVIDNVYNIMLHKLG